jgi:hypothetical protein
MAETATLCSLAFSDYQLWADPSLRDPNRDGCTCDSRSDLSDLIAFKVIPIRTLFRRSHVFHDDNPQPTDVSVVKCLTSHASHFFDIQMIIVDKTRPRTLAGGYEIRRKDWAEVTLRFPSFSPEYWDARTVYIVRRVPPNSSLNL